MEHQSQYTERSGGDAKHVSEAAAIDANSEHIALRRDLLHRETWLLTANGLKNLLGEKHPDLSVSDALHTGLRSRTDTLYLATQDNSLLIVEGNKVKERIASTSMITSLFETHSGRILVGLNGPGLAEVRDDRELVELGNVTTLPSRSKWHTPWDPNDVDVHSFVQLPSGAILVCLHVGGILRSEDDGQSWFQVEDGMDRIKHRGSGRYDIVAGVGLHPDVHELAVHPEDSSMIFAATRDGFYRSVDEGKTFAPSNEGIEVKPGTWNYQRALGVFPDRDVLLTTTSSGPGKQRDARLFRSEDRGVHWNQVRGLPEALPHIHSIQCNSSGTGFILVGNQVFDTLDYGASWNLVVSAPNDFYQSGFHHVVRPLI